MIAGQGQSTQIARVARPHLGWWITVLSGMVLLAVLAFDAGAYAAWCANVTTVLPQRLLQGIFIAALATHIGEAAYAFRLASRCSLRENAFGWFLQTFLLGYPSLRLLRRRAAA
jgi:hypothetical protein